MGRKASLLASGMLAILAIGPAPVSAQPEPPVDWSELHQSRIYHLIRLGRFDEAVALADQELKGAERAFEHSPQNLIDYLKRRSDALLSKGDYAAAEADCRRLIELQKAAGLDRGEAFQRARQDLAGLLAVQGKTSEMQQVMAESANPP